MESGQILDGRYRLLERIGVGGMGEVWRATDLRLETDVAVKSFHERFAQDHGDGARRLLQHEARITASLRNPHIVPVLDIAEDAAYLVMEYVPARNLREIVKTDGPLPPSRVAEIGAQIADALRATHAAGIVHGDVTPANVLIDRNGTARLTDFGIARRMAPGGTMTDVGLVHGSPGYIAPELADGDEVTPASDMFGLGATLFTAAEGKSPYGDGTPVVLVRRARDYGSHRFDLLPCQATGPLTPVVGRLLARSTKRRPPASATCEVLRDTAQQTGVSSTAELTPDPVIPRIQEAMRSALHWVLHHGRVAVAAGTAVAVLIVVTVVLADRHPARASTGLSAGKPTTAVGSSTQSVASGQTSATTPSPSQTGSSTQTGFPAQIGDPRTLDPCALTNASALNRYGSTQVDPNYGSFDRCDVLVQATDSVQVDVETQFQTPDQMAGTPSPSPGAGGTNSTSGANSTSGTGSASGITVARPAGKPGDCDRFLTLTGGYGVVVTADTDTSQPGASSVNLCTIADTATTTALSALGHGSLPHRNAPATSLAHADACRLLNASALAAVPGLDATRFQAGFGDFSCRWAGGTGGESVMLRFDQNDPLDSTDGTARTLSGRPAYVKPGGDGGDQHNCLVRVVYRSFSGATGPTEELLYLVVAGDQSNDALCGPATRLATAASAALPTA